MKIQKVIIVDDHEIFRIGLKQLLNKIDCVEVVGEASNGKEFLDIIENMKVDIVFMDISMPVMDGIQASMTVLEKHPDLKIIALTTFGDTEYFDKMIYAGVQGFMLKNSTLEDFERAIRKVADSGNFFSEEMLARITRKIVEEKIREIDEEKLPKLSNRENEVLKLICKGFTNEKIAECLCISSRTVERHKTNLINKTGTKNTLNLVIYAFKNNLVEL
ncbi:MAG: response regulator transcription factor [Bacteroidales bacterium]|nr:MAG: response regulator transcription factor [Bacteroidales bacterium]